MVGSKVRVQAVAAAQQLLEEHQGTVDEGEDEEAYPAAQRETAAPPNAQEHRGEQTAPLSEEAAKPHRAALQ